VVVSGVKVEGEWAGGKTQLLSQFEKFFPTQFNRYYEPF
jgi:site-specific DNA-adenine methylase